MDFFKSQFDRIGQQLSGLNGTQKMLTAALVGLMVMTFLFWGRYAGQPEMEPVLSQSLTDADLARISAQLDARGLQYKVSADKKVLVAADRKIEAIAALGYANVLPRDTANGYDEIIKQVGVWDGQDRTNQMFNRGKELTLARVIGNFPGVAHAVVGIDPQSKRQIGVTAGVDPTAFVNIEMQHGIKAGDQLITAAANVVTGAQSGMQMKNVRVVVDGVRRVVKGDSADDGAGSVEDIAEAQYREEARLTKKVVDQLADIPHVLVAVTVKINNRISVLKKKTIDKDNTLQKEIRTESISKESTAPAAAPLEPGAGSNVGLAINSGAGGEGGQSHTEEKVDFTVLPSYTEEESKIPAGESTAIGASVRVPRSYFARIAKGAGDREPDDAAINAKMREIVPTIQASVMRCVGLATGDGVTVDTYFDVADAMPLPQQAVAASALSVTLGGHSKEIVLGALTLVSLFMVSMIVRKSAPAVLAVAPSPVAPAASAARIGESIAAEVGEGGSLLNGMELDDEAVQTQQILQQVSAMVQEDPDAAASLVNRWLSRT